MHPKKKYVKFQNNNWNSEKTKLQKYFVKNHFFAQPPIVVLNVVVAEADGLEAKDANGEFKRIIVEPKKPLYWKRKKRTPGFWNVYFVIKIIFWQLFLEQSIHTHFKVFGSMRREKKAFSLQIFVWSLVYLFFDQCFFNKIIHFSRSYDNFFIAKYWFIFELCAILWRAKKSVVRFPLLLKTGSSTIKNSNEIH